MVYVCMQTFAVPGTLSLSLLSGAMYGTLTGLLLVSGQMPGKLHACHEASVWECVMLRVSNFCAFSD